jgi:hypothetical protein
VAAGPAMIDELLGWGLRPSMLVADSAAATAGRCRRLGQCRQPARQPG